MKLTCTNNDLLNGVNTVLKAISNRTTLPILECILLEADGDYLKLTGNDLEIGIESKLAANIEKQVQLLLKQRYFLK